MVRVLLVDDHRMFAEALREALEREPDIEVVDIAVSFEAAKEAAWRTRPDVVLMDHLLPDAEGAEVAPELLQDLPDLKIVILTGVEDERVALQAMQSGCAGYVVKSGKLAGVADAVRSAQAGEMLMSPGMLSRLLPRFAGTGRRPPTELTSREREILQLVGQGLTNDEIAAQLFLSPLTVRNHMQNVMSKLGAHTKLEAVLTGVRTGLITVRR